MPTTPRTKSRSGVPSAGPRKRAAAVKQTDITYAKKLVDPSLFFQESMDTEFYFRLAATFPSKEVYVKAQRVTLGDEMLDGRFPADFTEDLLKGLQFVSDESHGAFFEQMKNANDLQALAMAARTPEIKPLLDAAIVMGFLEPKAYLKEDDAKANGGIPVEKIRFADKLRFVAELQKEDAAADALFPPAPRPEA